MSRFDTVMAALERGERDAQLLDGRDFDALYWRNARRQLNVLRRELDAAERLSETQPGYLSAIERAEASGS